MTCSETHHAEITHHSSWSHQPRKRFEVDLRTETQVSREHRPSQDAGKKLSVTSARIAKTPIGRAGIPYSWRLLICRLVCRNHEENHEGNSFATEKSSHLTASPHWDRFGFSSTSLPACRAATLQSRNSAAMQRQVDRIFPRLLEKNENIYIFPESESTVSSLPGRGPKCVPSLRWLNFCRFQLDGVDRSIDEDSVCSGAEN